MRQLEAKYGIKLGPENTQFADFSALCEDIGEHVVATAWTLQHPAVASAIVGVHNVEQLDGFEEAARLHLNPEAMQYLDETFSINRSHKLRPGAAPEAYSW